MAARTDKAFEALGTRQLQTDALGMKPVVAVITSEEKQSAST
jgi:hypothetical protein